MSRPPRSLAKRNVNIYAEIDSSSTVDTSFEQGVTLTVSGSGTGGGLVTIVNGVGTTTVSDHVAQTVTLGLQDSQSTSLNVGATANVTLFPDTVAQFALNHPGNMNVGSRLGYAVSREDQFGNLRFGEQHYGLSLYEFHEHERGILQCGDGRRSGHFGHFSREHVDRFLVL